MRSTIKKWFLLLASGSFLLQATSGCDSQLQSIAASSIESFVTGVVSLYIEAGVGNMLNV